MTMTTPLPTPPQCPLWVSVSPSVQWEWDGVGGVEAALAHLWAPTWLCWEFSELQLRSSKLR